MTAKSATSVTVCPRHTPVTKSNTPAKHATFPQSKPKEPVVPTQPNHLLDYLCLKVGVKLTRKRLTPVPTLPSGPVHTRNVLKNIFLFFTEDGSKA
jgi:hypothetical protein